MTKEEILKPYVDGRRVQREEALFCMEAYKDQETVLLSDKLAKMELMYEKLANIHSHKVEKYNKLKDAFEGLLKEADGKSINAPIKDNHFSRFWLVKAELKEQ